MGATQLLLLEINGQLNGLGFYFNSKNPKSTKSHYLFIL